MMSSQQPSSPPQRRVKLLPDKLINRIAAGEVVERPAAVLKELVENSLDAGADRIDIEVAGGGKKLIRVRDNGCGMSRDDLLLCLERHATSKIDSDSDLMAISSLGFRGEALPSIGAVSRLTITSARAGEPGYSVSVNHGTLIGGGAPQEAAANRGTTVEVKDLFSNVPARRKFLKSDQTEAAHLLDVAQTYALARPNLRLTYREGGREILAVDSQHDFATRVFKALGRQAAEGLTPMRYQAEGLELRGWLGPPDKAVSSPAHVFIYVCGRPVKDRLLKKALLSGYGRLLAPGQWPSAIIFIDMDPREVDVNVHPAKAELRFREPGRVFTALSEAVSRVMGRGLVYTEELRCPQPAPPSHHLKKAAGGDSEPGLIPKLENTPPPWLQDKFEPPAAPWLQGSGSEPPSWEAKPISPAPAETGPPLQGPAEATATPEPEEPSPPRGSLDDLAQLQPLAQLYQSYILAQGPKGLYLIDQHAGHERVIYNRLRLELLRHGLEGQNLMFPETLELTPQQALAAETLTPHLERLGFELSPFGERSFLLKAKPAILKAEDPIPALLEILDKGHSRLKSLEGAGLVEGLTAMANSWLYSLACRAAVKAGDKMSLEEMAALLADMAATPNGAYCPHGRPAVQVIDRALIEKRFDRR